jgi:hypothetical protein
LHTHTHTHIYIYITYASRKSPASARHLTVLPGGKNVRKSSQCRMDASPPAEQPVSRTWLADAIPMERRCLTVASQMRWPRK